MPDAVMATRAAALQAVFQHIAVTRMAGLALCHPALRVEAVGFRRDEASGGAVGVLVTPWFMNLVWLPPAAPAPGAVADAPCPQPPPGLLPGALRARRIGAQAFDFIGAHEDGIGPYESCSLFSPMFEFADQTAARATAEAVLAMLWPPRGLGTPADAPDPLAVRALPGAPRSLRGRSRLPLFP
jgi:[NiFe] hydrogenase assembly HybE family chaperone